MQNNIEMMVKAAVDGVRFNGSCTSFYGPLIPSSEDRESFSAILAEKHGIETVKISEDADLHLPLNTDEALKNKLIQEYTDKLEDVRKAELMKISGLLTALSLLNILKCIADVDDDTPSDDDGAEK